jgi:hypothetical protein
MAKKPTEGRRKLVEFDAQTWHALNVLDDTANKMSGGQQLSGSNNLVVAGNQQENWAPASAISPDSSDRDQRLDQQRFRPLGKVVVGNLDRIADIDNVGN